MLAHSALARAVAVTVALAVTAAACANPIEPSDLAGTWGGEHAEVTFDATGGATIQYDCAHGRMNAPITLSATGAFEGFGFHVPEHGGPVREGEILDSLPARYTGTIRGSRLTFAVELTGSSTSLGQFTVVHNGAAQLFRCL